MDSKSKEAYGQKLHKLTGIVLDAMYGKNRAVRFLIDLWDSTVCVEKFRAAIVYGNGARKDGCFPSHLYHVIRLKERLMPSAVLS